MVRTGPVPVIELVLVDLVRRLGPVTVHCTVRVPAVL